MTTASNIGVGATNITTLGTITTGTWNGSVIGGTYGGTGVNNGASTFTIGGNTAFSGAHTFTGTITADTAVTFPTSGTLATTAQLIATPVSGANGGTGVANTGSTITIGGNVTFSGAHTFTGTLTNNTSVTFPTSGTLSTTGGTSPLVPLATLTASNSASLAFTSLFSSSYYQYLFVFTNILPATDNTFLECQLGTGAGPTYITANYLWQDLAAYQGNNKTGQGSVSDSKAVIAEADAFGISNSSTYNGASGQMWLSGTNGSSAVATGTGQFSFEANTITWSTVSNSWQQPAALFTAIKFFMSSGNITSGTIDVYGLAAG